MDLMVIGLAAIIVLLAFLLVFWIYHDISSNLGALRKSDDKHEKELEELRKKYL